MQPTLMQVEEWEKSYCRSGFLGEFKRDRKFEGSSAQTCTLLKKPYSTRDVAIWAKTETANKCKTQGEERDKQWHDKHIIHKNPVT